MTRCPSNLRAVTLADLVMLCRDMRPDEVEQAQAFMDLEPFDPDAFAAMLYLRSGPRFTVQDDEGRPIVAGGYTSTDEGQMDAWMVGTMAGWAKHWRVITKASRWMADNLLAMGVRRLQVWSLASRVDTGLWYERLGFVCEGVRKAAGRQGQDVAMYARVGD